MPSCVRRDAYSIHRTTPCQDILEPKHDYVRTHVFSYFNVLVEKGRKVRLSQHVARIESSLEADPSQAIGSAKELIETAAKIILKNHGISLEAKTPDMTQLNSLVAKTLQHIPPGLNDSADAKQAVKILLSSLGNIVDKVGQLRNYYGTGHGKTGDMQSLEARHARLAVGAATVVVSYWLETDNRATPESE